MGGVWSETGLSQGLAAGEHHGIALAGGGDYDGDGVGDWLVGSFKAMNGNRPEAGRVEVISGADGSVLASIAGLKYDRLGGSVDWIGDIDGDGRDDFLAGAVLGANLTSGTTLTGRAYVWSSAANGPLRVHEGTTQGEHFGSDVAGGMDLDGDGVNDYVVGSRFFVVNGLPVGAVFAYSGASGAQLWRIDGPSAWSHFGAAVDLAGDVDGDGTPDVLVGSAVANANAGFAAVYSGATGAQILQVVGLGGENLGADVAGIGDVDGDGYADLLVGAPSANNGVGAAYIFSGFSGTILQQFDGAPGGQLGYGLSLAGDVDGDGQVEVIVGAPNATPTDTGYARIYTAATGALVKELTGNAPNDFFGRSSAGIGDTDGDGCDEFVIGAHRASNAAGDAFAGEVRRFDFNPILFTDVVEMGAAAGGQVDCQFDFPDSEAGKLYAVVVSYSGTGPTNYAGIDLPLGRDTMFDRTVNGDWPRIFTAPHGVLDPNGDGSTLYIGDALWLTPRIGETFHGCVVSYDNAGPRLVSVARPLTILP
ncbi:MAG: hypothetical protein D6702_07995 [Planctomycetota bacterium]|nr:MAG: hypothetical protein D6702_07995 [Planctomycetota bacterium]